MFEEIELQRTDSPLRGNEQERPVNQKKKHMIHLKHIPYRRLFAGLAVCAAMASIGPAVSYADATHPARQQPAVSVERTTPAPEKASSALWRTYIWDAFPADRLKGADPDMLSEAYQANDWKPFFINSHFQLNEAAQALLARLKALESEAIDPKPYKLEELARSVEKLERAQAALKTVEPMATDSSADALQDASPSPQGPGQASTPDRLARYRDAFAVAGGLDVRFAVDFARFAKETNPFSRDDQIRALTGEISMAKFLKSAEPNSPQYSALLAGYAHYTKLAGQAGLQRYSSNSALHPGESGPQVRDLQKRLQQEGFYSGKITGVYDSETQHGLKNFQAAHNIEPDGVVGQRTRDWLNTPLQDKADMIAYSMRMLRQSQTRSFDRYIRINIPQFLLEYHKDGKIQETHRVVVGKASGKLVKFRGKMVGENQTPTLTSAVQQVILNPRWYVSDRISLELNTAAKSDPYYWSKHGYVQMASLYPWGQPRIFQRPGPKNALGRVKFEFPNAYAVYLHDTPTKHLFQRSRRDFSHGCIRVDKAVELARTLLNDDKSTYAQKMDTVLGGEHQAFAKLSQPVPIAIEYIPVLTNNSGHLVFFGDPYGLLKEDTTPKR